MKTVLAAAAAFLSTTAFSKTVIQYTFAQPGQDQAEIQMVQVQVSDKGKMDIQVSTDGRSTIDKIDAQIDTRNFSNIQDLAGHISTQEVKTTVRANVCVTFVAPIPNGPLALKVAEKFDYTTREFKGKLRLVKTPNACYYRDVTEFTDEYNRVGANRLESFIQALAVRAIEDAGI